MRIKELLLVFIIMSIGMNVSVNAQKNYNDEYRTVAAWLIEDNLRTASVKGNPLICSDMLEKIIEAWKFWSKQKKYAPNYTEADIDSVRMKYYVNHIVDDMADVFVDNCAKDISLEDLKELKEQWLTIKMVNLFDRDDVNSLLIEATDNYLLGKFNGYKEPECTESYLALFNQFYTLLGLPERFEKDKKRVAGLKRFSKERVESFYAQQPRIFVLLICQRNISEENMKKCIDYLTDNEKENVYERILKISKRSEKQITDKQVRKFVTWLDNAVAENLYKDCTKEMAKDTKKLLEWLNF